MAPFDGGSEYSGDRFQISHARDLVRFEIATLRPFVPCVDTKKVWSSPATQPLTEKFQSSLKSLWGISSDTVGKSRLRQWLPDI